jgi:hypothetical protein
MSAPVQAYPTKAAEARIAEVLDSILSLEQTDIATQSTFRGVRPQGEDDTSAHVPSHQRATLNTDGGRQ